ncbi:hypothetical protein [Clostridium chauvoei]|uniref:DUF3784 domain-containing protein n=2 Tax=Clostridium chauvoei TaxID=46867 RepID=S6F6P8_9CLOT|nr:hypothetical protein [Clostridium chauvoei]ATD54045.1 hypothetical protein BTM20_01855 [Clostridium chauvoei]ATD58502.1 hypothetical protein BTM21_12595 [Clostridium chauvoei]MBX7281324.1 hypothetical protein [Clostridium chauvoei]MBX7283770.1 hypothetical protein [Clostridium chauvoei]MBX7286413.1 hypothetical protein [Clostridium chauvoei]
MRGSTIVMIVASIGFILIGLVILSSKKIRKLMSEVQIYTDTNKFISFNGKFNIIVGLAGLLLGGLDYMFEEQSKYIVVIFIIVMVTASLLQNKLGKKYKKY